MPDQFILNSTELSNLFPSIHTKTLTMSSREIADLTQKRHNNVKRDINNMLLQLNMNVLNFERIYLDDKNREQIEYHLDQDLTMTLVMGYSIPLRHRVAKRWRELEEKTIHSFLSIPDFTNPAMAARAWADEFEQRRQLAHKIEEMKPEVEAFHRIAKSDGSLCITNAAKDLQMRPIDLTRYLSSMHWIYRRVGNSSWCGYQDKIQQGLLEHKVTTVERSDGTEKTVEQVRITAKGLVKLSKLLQLREAS